MDDDARIKPARLSTPTATIIARFLSPADFPATGVGHHAGGRCQAWAGGPAGGAATVDTGKGVPHRVRGVVRHARQPVASRWAVASSGASRLSRL